MFYTYNGTEFSAVPFAKCSSCGQLIKLEIKNETVLTNSRKCPFCKIELEEVEITSSFAQSLITTAGLQAAGKVLGFDAALFIFFSLCFQWVALRSAAMHRASRASLGPLNRKEPS